VQGPGCACCGWRRDVQRSWSLQSKDAWRASFRSHPESLVAQVSPDALDFTTPWQSRAAGGRYTFPNAAGFPRVPIIYAHADMDVIALDSVLATGPAGIVLAGVGHGNAPRTVIDRLAKAAADGIIVVRSTRINEGSVASGLEVDDEKLGFLAGGALSPQKARLLLQLLLSNRVSPENRQAAFLEC
jgi:L-asparaginase